MKRTALAIALAAIALTASGLAARDVRSIIPSEPMPHEVHFGYYEQIRPVLVGTDAVRMLCIAEPVADARDASRD